MLFTVYASGGMLEMSNGYPNSASPLEESSPPPGASPGKQGKHSPRSSLRVLIPSQSGSLAPDEVTADSCHSNGDRSIFDEVGLVPVPGSWVLGATSLMVLSVHALNH